MTPTTPFRDLVPPLSTAELDALRTRIADEGGVHDPVLLSEDGEILDGHNRYSIDPHAPTKVIAGSGSWSDAQKRAFVVRCNVARRNLSPEQRTDLLDTQRAVALDLKREGKTQDEIARLFGVHRTTVGRWLPPEPEPTGHNVHVHNVSTPSPPPESPILDTRVMVLKQAYRHVVNRVDAGATHAEVAADLKVSTKTVQRIVTATRARDQQREHVNAIAKREVADTFDRLYDVIVIDPPWPMSTILRDVRPAQQIMPYPVMSEDQLTALKIPAAADCHVWLWTTHHFEAMAMRLLDRWQLKYQYRFIWHKPGGFQPFGLPQFNYEMALYARRGSPSFASTKDFRLCFDAPRGRHSEKPDVFYDMVQRVTTGERLDMFARKTREGFTAWGNEIQEDETAA